MNENMLAPRRNIGAKAHLTLPTGAKRELSGADILAFSVEEGADSPLLPGAVLSARLNLTVSNPDDGWRDVPLMGATVQVSVICEGHELPCGVFIVDGVSAKERSGAIVLSGSDSVASELSGAFSDELSYPAALGQLWQHLISQTRYVFTSDLPGGAVSERPEWGNITLRRAAGWIAQAAGCFVRANRLGEIELVPCTGGAVKRLGPEGYLSLDDGFEAFGPVTGLRIVSKAGEAFEVSNGPGEMLCVEGNPLFGEDSLSLAQSMLSKLDGLRLEKASFRWRGEPGVGVGSRIALTDTYGNEKICTVTRQTMRFENGFSADCICSVPENTPGGVPRAITPEGGVNADALVGTVNGGLLRAESVTARAIAAKSVTADKLAAGAITADHLSAGSVTADKLEAASVSGVTAQFVAAEMEKLTAGDVETDRLYAAVAHIVSLAAGSITAGSVKADRLGAALAEFVSVYAKTGEFDFAAVENLVSGALSLQQGAMDTVYIKNLAVTQANLLSATLGKLILKGDDGGYYQVFVGSDGMISAQKVSQTGDLPSGGQIVETNMNVASLNAMQLQASAAVINEILTSALEAGKITAADALIASATIPELYVTTIRAIGESLELVNGRTNIIHRGETPPVDAGEGDLWVQPGTGSLFQLADVNGLPDFYLDGEGALYYRYGEDQTVYALTLDENGNLYVDGAAPFAMAIGPDGEIIAWARVKDGELQAGIDENKEAIDGANKLIREQSAKITEMADAIDLRVTTKVYEEGLEGLGELIQKNEASITLLDKSITSKVSQEVYDEDTGAIREEVSEIKQTADNIRLEVSKKTATFSQESTPTSFAEGDIWIKPGTGAVYEAVKNSSGALEWQGSVLTSSKLHTSYIDIAQDHIDISTGGSLNVNSGAAHFRTKEYTLSILADDNSEDTVMDFDAESKTLRVNEIVAGNARPYIAGTTTVTSDEIGGMDGLAGMLAGVQYEHIIYRQTTPDFSPVTIVIRGSNSLNVEIRGDGMEPVQIPPVQFIGITGNVTLENLKWSTQGIAVSADSGNLSLLNCYMDANIGLYAQLHARANWVGTGHETGSMDTAGACTNMAAAAVMGAEIRLYGLIPAGALVETRGGAITAVNTVTGAGGAVEESVTKPVEASVGYYGTANGWKAGQLYQGYSTGKGRIYGCMKFEIPAGVGTVKSAVLVLHRYKDAGKGSEVDVDIYGSATAYGSRPELGAKYFAKEDAAAPGASVSFDVTSAAQALVDGTIRQLVLYNGDTKTMSGKVYSSNYALFDSAVLKITY